MGFFRDVITKAKQPVSSHEIGISFANWDKSGRGDNEFVPALRGIRGVQTYRKMALNDATISSVLFAVEMSIRNIEWTVDANEFNGTDDKDLEFIKTALFEDMEHSFQDFVTEALSFLTYGWCVHEKVFKLRNGHNPDDPKQNSLFSDGRIGIRKLSLRSQASLHRWLFDDHGGIKGLEQFTTNKGVVPIPIDKCVYFRTTGSDGAPEGRSMLRGAYRSWYFLRHLEEIEVTAIERELNGLPVMYVPGELLQRSAAGDADAAATVRKYEEAARDVKLNAQGSLVLPSDVYVDNDGKLTNNRKVMFELAASSGTRNIDASAVIMRYQGNILRTVLADFILLGSSQSSGSGSYALGAARSELFQDALGGWVDMMTETVNRAIIQPLWEMNGLPEAKVPALKHSTISKETLTELADYIQKLAAAGMPLFPDEELEDHLRLKADLPRASEELDSLRTRLAVPEPVTPKPLPVGASPPKQPTPAAKPKPNPNK